MQHGNEVAHPTGEFQSESEMFREGVDNARIAELPALISNATLCRKEMDYRKNLISFDDAMAIFRKFFDFLLTRLKRLPADVAARCNPQTPLHAFHILEAEVNSIIADAETVVTDAGVVDSFFHPQRRSGSFADRV